MKNVSFGLIGVMLVAGLAGCGDTTYIKTSSHTPDIVSEQPVGTAYVSKSSANIGAQYAPYGQANITLNTFNVAMDAVEDGILEVVVPEVYSNSYQELLPTWTLQNIRVISTDNVQMGPTMASLMARAAAPENNWKDTTYVYLPVQAVIPRGTIATFRITGDSGWSWMSQVVVTLPDAGTGMFADGIGGHIVVRGATSGKILKVVGESIGDSIFFYDPYGKG